MNAKHLTAEQEKIMVEFRTNAYAMKGMASAGLNPYESEDGDFFFPIPDDFAPIFGNNGRITEICIDSVGHVTLQMFGVKSLVSVMDFSDEMVEEINLAMHQTIRTILDKN